MQQGLGLAHRARELQATGQAAGDGGGEHAAGAVELAFEPRGAVANRAAHDGVALAGAHVHAHGGHVLLAAGDERRGDGELERRRRPEEQVAHGGAIAAVAALHQHRRRAGRHERAGAPRGEHVVGGVLRLCGLGVLCGGGAGEHLLAVAGQRAPLRQVGREQARKRQQVAADRAPHDLAGAAAVCCGGEHGVDDDRQVRVGGALLAQEACHGHGGLGTAEHAHLDSGYGQLAEGSAHLRLDHARVHELHRPERAAALRGDAGQRDCRMDPQGRGRLDVCLDPGASAAVRAPDGQDAGFHGCLTSKPRITGAVLYGRGGTSPLSATCRQLPRVE